eukprot:16336442-Heterocapsa_arctica.AAC.1
MVAVREVLHVRNVPVCQCQDVGHHGLGGLRVLLDHEPLPAVELMVSCEAGIPNGCLQVNGRIVVPKGLDRMPRDRLGLGLG